MRRLRVTRRGRASTVRRGVGPGSRSSAARGRGAARRGAAATAQLQAVSEPGATQVIVGTPPGRPDRGGTRPGTRRRRSSTSARSPPSKTASRPRRSPGRSSWTRACQSYGRKDSSHGLTTALGVRAARRDPAGGARGQPAVVPGASSGLWPSGPTGFQTAVRPVAIDPAITPGPSDPARARRRAAPLDRRSRRAARPGSAAP